MKKFLLILLFPILLFSQTDIFSNRVRTDSLKAFKTTYGTLDSIHIKSRTNFTRPAEFDSLVRFFTNFAVPLGSSYDTLRLAYKADSAIALAGYGWTPTYSGHSFTGVVDSSIFLNKAGNQVGISGNKTWEGTNTFTARDFHTSIASDTTMSKSSSVSYIQPINGYSTLTGDQMTTGVTYTHLFGSRVHAQYHTIGGFAWANSKDTIPFGHSTVSMNVPMTLYNSIETAQYGIGLGFLNFMMRHQTDSANFSIYLQKTQDGDLGTATLNFNKTWGRINSVSGYGLPDQAGDNLVWLRVDSSNHIRFNYLIQNGASFGNVYVDTGDFAVSQGKITASGSGTFGGILKTTSVSGVHIGNSSASTGLFTIVQDSAAANDRVYFGFNGSAGGSIQFYANGISTTRTHRLDADGSMTLGTTSGTGVGSFYSGAITSTGLSTFDSAKVNGFSQFIGNIGHATVGAGDSVQITVQGLTTATGEAGVLGYRRTGATSVVVADTIASSNITTDGKLTLYGKYGWVVSYWIGRR